MKKIFVTVLTFVLLVSNSIYHVAAQTLQGPGPVKPIDVKELGSFKGEENWNVSGAIRRDTSSGTVFKLTGENATISKEFTYKTWEYSDLSIEVKSITDNMRWGLSVRGSEVGSKEMTIQSESKSANSQYGEAFTYSLEGIAGAESNSNWNDETLSNKTFTMTFKLTGEVDEEIKFGKLKCIKPNYEVPKALDSNVKGKYTGMNFDGDPSLDVDKIKNDDSTISTSAQLKEHQWSSLPYSRLIINPGWEFDNGKITPVDPDLDFKFGTYYGIKGNANMTAGSESKSGFQPSFYNSILTINNERIDTKTIKSAWYPHKLERSGSVPNKGDIALIDFMVDANTMGRIIDFDSESSNLDITVKDSSKVGGANNGRHNLRSQWDDVNKVVIKTDDLEQSKNLFYQAIKVVALNEDGSYNKTLTDLITTPEFVNGVGRYQVPSQVKKVGLVIGYATKEEGQEVAINRALKNTMQGNLLKGYNNTKEYWNNLLRKVPVPEKWGIDDTNIKNYDSVTPEKHKVLYYSGYVFNSINTLGVTPETGYAYTQQALGKPSRQVAGSNMTPANNCWEGVLQIQNIMYIDPSASWSAMEGFMSMVDANGFLNGEVLPVRMAQTIWMLNTISPDKERLKAIYPALSRHLKYKISDPRWIYENEKTYNEIDQEYITSWLNDAIYMKEICKYLGGDYAKEIDEWEARYQKSLTNYADWFFSDPLSHEAKGSYPEDGSGPRTLRNGLGLENANQARGLWTRIFHKDGDVLAFKDACSTNNDEGNHYAHSNKGNHVITPAPGRFPREWLQVILSGLVIKDIPTEQAKQLEQFFLDINNPALPLAGLENLKWAPNSLIVYGLIHRGFYDEAKNQLDSYLVKTVEVWEFCENYKYLQSGPYGTSPTSFGASQIIEVTMLKNGVMNDGSGVKVIEQWNEGKYKAKSPEINMYYSGEFDKDTVLNDLPKEVIQVYDRVNFNNDKYKVNKATAVKWNVDTVKSSQAVNQEIFTVTGETETHDTITATVNCNVTSVELAKLVDYAQETINKVNIGSAIGDYTQESVDELNKVIDETNAMLNKRSASLEDISLQIKKLDNAIYQFKIKPLSQLIEKSTAIVESVDIGNELGQYSQSELDMLIASTDLAKEDLHKDRTIEVIMQRIVNLKDSIHSFRVSPVKQLLDDAKNLHSSAVIGEKKGEYSKKVVDDFYRFIEKMEIEILNTSINNDKIVDLVKQVDMAIKEFKENKNGEKGIIIEPGDEPDKKDPIKPQTSDNIDNILNVVGLMTISSLAIIYYFIKHKKKYRF